MSFRHTRTTPVLARPAVRVRVTGDRGDVLETHFAEPFTIGRDDSCDVQIDSGLASRRHAEVTFEDYRWIFRDLGSTNGSFVDGNAVHEVAIGGPLQVQLGNDGPVISFDLDDSRGAGPVESTPIENARGEGARRAHAVTPASEVGGSGNPSLSGYLAKYFVDDSNSPGGEHTQMIRRAYATVQDRHRRKYLRIAAAGALLVVVLLAYAGWQRVQVSKLEQRAAQAFSTMRQLDVQMAKLQHFIEERGEASLNDQLAELEDLRTRMRTQYEGYVDELGIRRRLNREEAVIYRVARIFNESEFEMPATFVRAVRQTIQDYWLTGGGRGRLERAILRAEQEGYTPRIVESMMRHGLPPEFFYLALQESDFDPRVVGPATRWGIAKGMWQFIPETARAYGLMPGPREDQRVYDPQDDRHDAAAATDAAARYLLEIYGQLAQASGLLAMASYNWGEHRVVGRLHALMEGIPDDPEARSYWRFLTEYSDRMPEETKDYVLKIFAAAVIGQDPRLFGFDFDNPLLRHIEAGAESLSMH